MGGVLTAPRKRIPTPAGPPASGISLGRIADIEVRISPSLLVIAALIISSLAVEFMSRHPGDPTRAWTVAVVAGVLFFGSILAHELAHSLVARLRGVGVHGITLFIFGGVSRMKEEPRKAGDEVLIALVGPVASAVIGGACLGLAGLLPAESLQADAAVWLGRVNLQLAVFNLLPGFPLDGGRVFRAAVWGLTGDLRKATRWAAASGRIVAHGLILTGAILFFGYGRLDGIWLGLIGMFLVSAVQASLAQARLKEALEGMLVRRALRKDFPTVFAGEQLETIVSERVLVGDHECFAVAEDGEIRGLLTADRILSIPAMRWPGISAGEAMIAIESFPRVSSGSTLHEALAGMESSSSAWLPVFESGSFAGLVQRDDILRLARLQLQFGGERR